MKRAFKASQGVVRALLGVCLALSIVLTGIHTLEWMEEVTLKPSVMAYVVFIGILVGCYLVISWVAGGFGRR